MIVLVSGFSPTFAYKGDKYNGREIILGALKFPSHAASFIAYEKGYFKKEKLIVKFRYYDSAYAMANGLIVGDIDFAITAITPELVNNASGINEKIKIFGSMLKEDAQNGQLILSSVKDYNNGLTNIKAFNNYNNTLFGLTSKGSTFHYMAYKIYEKLDIANLPIKVLNDVTTIKEQLKRNTISSMTIIPGVGKQMVNNNDAKIIGKIFDIIPDYQITVMFTSITLIKNHKELVRAFKKALEKGANDYNEALVDRKSSDKEKVDVIAILKRYVYPDLSQQQAEQLIKEGAMRLSPESKLNMANINDQLNFFEHEGLTPKGIKASDIAFNL